MSLSDSIIRILKRIQRKSVEERRKIQVFVVATFLIFFLVLGIVSLSSEFSKSGNPFATVNETEQSRQLKGLFGKIGNLGRKTKEGFNKIKGDIQGDKEIRKFFENDGR